MQMENQVHCYKYQVAFYTIWHKMLVCPSHSDSHLLCMFHAGKPLPCSPTVFHMNSQESDDTEKFAAGFGRKLPPWTSTYNTPCTCSSMLSTVTFLPEAFKSKSCMAERQRSMRWDSKCDSCHHSVTHQVELFASAAFRFTLVKFIIFKCTSLSPFSFLRLENEVIVDSSGILCLQMKWMLLWGLHYQLTFPSNEVWSPLRKPGSSVIYSLQKCRNLPAYVQIHEILFFF